MHIATSIDGPIIRTRFEPIEAAEWAAVDSVDEAAEGGGFWVVIFSIQKNAVSRFVDDLESALAEIGEQFSVSTVAASRYVYVVASTAINDLEVSSDDGAQKAWMACMRLARAYESNACTLFSPMSFLMFDRPRAESLLSGCLELQVSHIR